MISNAKRVSSSGSAKRVAQAAGRSVATALGFLEDGSMRDEYDVMDSSGETFEIRDFVLESGVVMPQVQVRYNTYGELNEAKDNVLIVCHALTGNSAIDKWWGDMLGPGKAFDTEKYLVVGANALCSCYGSSGPLSINPATNKLYLNNFPVVTIRDSVKAHMQLVKEGLGAHKLHGVVGGSLGGMQALEWALLGGKDFVPRIVAIGCGATHTAWQIAISEAQRQSIYFDEKWNGGNVDMDDPPVKGLNVARQMAMAMYRSSVGYESKFGRTLTKTETESKNEYENEIENGNGNEGEKEKKAETRPADLTSASTSTSTIDSNSNGNPGCFAVQSYLEHQGAKFVARFDAVTYVHLTRFMDTHDVGRGRGGVDAALGGYGGKALVMGMDTDVLYPLHMQQELAAGIPISQFVEIKTLEGHDGFLLEQEQVGSHLLKFLSSD